MCLYLPLLFLQTGCFKDSADRALDHHFSTGQDGYGAMKLCAKKATEVCEKVYAFACH